jgi:fatty-acyl-CoA synthase
MDVFSILERAEALHGDSTAVVDGASKRTYAETAARVRGVAHFLRERGLAPGERLAILEPNSAAYLESYFAAAALGLILVPLNVRLAPVELAAILRDAGTRVLVAHPAFAALVEDTLARETPLQGILWTAGGPPPRSRLDPASFEQAARSPAEPSRLARAGPDDIAQLYYTSGTTGRPKGVMLTHRNVLAHALGAIAELDLGQRDSWGHFAPMFHLADAWSVFAITWVGGRHVFVPRFEEEAVIAAIERDRVSVTNLVPAMLARIMQLEGVERRDLSSMRLLLSGGAPIAPALVRRALEVFRCEYAQTYGMTETSPFLTVGRLSEHHRRLEPEQRLALQAKAGRAFLAVELEVVDEEGSPVARDGRQVGEIRARGDTVTPGYWNQPQETAAAFRDGWLCTGDLANVDAEGFVEIVERRKDLIKSGGETVYSTEVEHALAEHPAVLESAVFGRPDPRWGERVCAAVVLRPGSVAGSDELESFCRARLAGFKVPRTFLLLSELPRTASGKVRKQVLRQL